MRVLHVAQPVEAGVARCVVELAGEQVRRGWPVAVACPGGWLAAAAAEVGAEVAFWPATRSPGPTVPAEARRLARVVAAWGPETVHLHSAKAGLAGRLAVRGRRPTIYQPHAWSFDATEPPLRNMVLAWERWSARWADLLLCVSVAERDHGIAERVHGNYAVAPNGVDLSIFTPRDAGARRRAFVALGLDEAPTVVCLGRLSRQKGQDLLLAAWPTVREAVPDARLMLVGDGPRDDLGAGPPAGVVFAGGTDDPQHWLTAANVVAVPSRWEGQARVVLEAMACGRSVVGSDAAGVSESLGEPPAGAVVPSGDTAALARELIVRLRDSAGADREGRAGAVWAAANHDMRINLVSCLALTQQVARRRAHS